MRSIVAVSIGWLGISMVGDGVPALVLPHQLASQGGDATRLGLITFVAIALAALVQPLAGAWSDRVGRQPVLGLGVVMALGGLGLLLVPAAVLPAAVLALMGVSVAQAAYQGLLPDRIEQARRGRAAGGKGFFDVLGAFLAFAFLAGALAAGDARSAVVFLGVGLVVPVALGLVLLGRQTAPSRAIAAEDGRVIISAALVQLIAARFLFLLGIYAVGRFLLLFMSERLALDPDAAGGEAGVVLAVLTVLTAATALPAGWLADRVGRSSLLLAGAVLAGAGIAALPFAASSGAILVFGSLMAVGSGLFGAASWALLADLSAGVHSGRLLGLANFGTAGAAAAAGLFGPLIDVGDLLSPGAGYGVAFAVAAATTVAGGILGRRLGAFNGSGLATSVEVSN